MFFLLPPVPATLTGAAAAFPIELCAEIGRRCALRLRAAREIRITSTARHRLPRDARPPQLHRRPGRLARGAGIRAGRIGTTPGEGSNTFPPGVVLAYPDPGSVRGVAVFEHHVGVGPVRTHLAVRYEQGRCVAAQGEGAEKLAALVEGDDYATDVAELAWGTNPHQTLTLGTERNPIDAERHSGRCTSAWARSPIFGSRTTSRLHLDGLIVRSLRSALDGEPIMTDGHLLVLDLPEVRAGREPVRRSRRAPARAVLDHADGAGRRRVVRSRRARRRLGAACPAGVRRADGRAVVRPLGPSARARPVAARQRAPARGGTLAARALPLQRRVRHAGGRDVPPRHRPRPGRGAPRPGARGAARDGARRMRPRAAGRARRRADRPRRRQHRREALGLRVTRHAGADELYLPARENRAGRSARGVPRAFGDGASA